MTVDEFIKEYEKYKSEDNKINFIKKHIINTYVPYEEKIRLCSNIVERSSVIDNKYKSNSPIRYMTYSLIIIDKYTDIDIDLKQSLSIFNKLEELDLVRILVQYMPKSELQKFDMIYNMVQEDYYDNTRTFVSYFENMINDLKKINDDIKAEFDKIQE